MQTAANPSCMTIGEPIILHDGAEALGDGAVLNTRNAPYALVKIEAINRTSLTAQARTDSGSDWVDLPLTSRRTGESSYTQTHIGEFIAEVAGYREFRAPLIGRVPAQPTTITARPMWIRPPQQHPFRDMRRARPKIARPDYDIVPAFDGSTGFLRATSVHGDVIYGSSGGNIRKSSNFGSTMSQLAPDTGGVVDAVWKFAGGHVVAAGRSPNPATEGMYVWRSDAAEDNFVATELGGAVGGFCSGEFGWDRHGDILLLGEYRTLVNYPNQGRRYYATWNAGADWSQILELPDNASLHGHGICYDPHEDLIWVVCGDGSNYSWVLCSPDRGETWYWIEQSNPIQFTGVGVVRAGIVLSSDNRPVGFYRIPRPAGGLRSILKPTGQSGLLGHGEWASGPWVEPSLIIEHETGYTPIGTGLRAGDQNGEDVVYGGFYAVPGAETSGALSGLWGTVNGVDWHKVWHPAWIPTQTDRHVGIVRPVAGVTDSGKLVVSTNMREHGGGGTGTRNVVIENPEWVDY